jgi:ABC-type uncharacterized transport system ATPase subunit
METEISGESAVKMVDIHKTFGAIHANNGVSLEIKNDEILSLLGENGSCRPIYVRGLAHSMVAEKAANVFASEVCYDKA